MIVNRFFSSKKLANEELARSARLLRTILLISLCATLAGSFAIIPSKFPVLALTIVLSLLVVEISSLVLLNKGKVRFAGIFLCSALWLILSLAAFLFGGVQHPFYSTLILITLISALILGGRASVIFSMLSVFIGLSIVLAEKSNLIPRPVSITPVGSWIIASVVFLASAGFVFMAVRSLADALGRAQRNEREQIQANQELSAIRDSLEQQVSIRTRELETRTRYLQASAEVSHAATSILDIPTLLQQAVELIQDKFGLYYVGLFLLEPKGEWAELRSGTGEAGRAMLAREHRIRVGTGMIGWSIANAETRVASDIGQDSVRLATAELPLTRSEAAIPLRSKGKILGALTVQSNQVNAFGETEIASLQSMSDQLSTAIDNARLFSDTRAALDAARQAYGEISRKAWSDLLRERRARGYRYNQNEIVPLYNSWSPEVQESIGSDEPSCVEANGKSTLWVPIQLREQTIGALRLNKNSSQSGFRGDEIEILKNISEQLGVALESARLYEGIQRRAEREKLAGQITAKIRASNDPQVILNTAITELRQALQASQTKIAIDDNKKQHIDVNTEPVFETEQTETNSRGSLGGNGSYKQGRQP